MASLDRMTGARHVFMPNEPSVGKARVILPAISWAAATGSFSSRAITMPMRRLSLSDSLRLMSASADCGHAV
jgi:hypothetical protein